MSKLGEKVAHNVKFISPQKAGGLVSSLSARFDKLNPPKGPRVGTDPKKVVASSGGKSGPKDKPVGKDPKKSREEKVVATGKAKKEAKTEKKRTEASSGGGGGKKEEEAAPSADALDFELDKYRHEKRGTPAPTPIEIAKMNKELESYKAASATAAAAAPPS